MPELNATSRVVRNPEIICGDIDGEIVALKIDSGAYLHLNPTASQIFMLLEAADQPLSPAALCQLLRREYRVTEEACLRDVLALFERCLELDMFRLVDEP